MLRVGSFVISALVLALSLSGCREDEGVSACDHVRDLIHDYSGLEINGQNYQRCLQEAALARSRDPVAFARAEACILDARALRDALSCGFQTSLPNAPQVEETREP